MVRSGRRLNGREWEASGSEDLAATDIKEWEVTDGKEWEA